MNCVGKPKVYQAVHAPFSRQKRGTDDDVSVTLSLILFDGEETFTHFTHSRMKIRFGPLLANVRSELARFMDECPEPSAGVGVTGKHRTVHLIRFFILCGSNLLSERELEYTILANFTLVH